MGLNCKFRTAVLELFTLNLVCLFWQRPRQRLIKMACMELCGGVHTAQRGRPMQISVGFCTRCISLCPGSVNEPLATLTVCSQSRWPSLGLF